MKKALQKGGIHTKAVAPYRHKLDDINVKESFCMRCVL